MLEAVPRGPGRRRPGCGRHRRSGRAAGRDAADCLLLHASPAEALQSTDYDNPEARAYVGYHHDVPQTKTYTASLLRVFQLAEAWAGLYDPGQAESCTLFRKPWPGPCGNRFDGQ